MSYQTKKPDRRGVIGVYQEDFPEEQLECRWIPVEERLPPDRVRVPVLFHLTFDTTPEVREVHLGLAALYDGVWKGVSYVQVTHWMPIPTAPDGRPIVF